MNKKKVTLEQQEVFVGWLESHSEIAAGRFLGKYGKARLEQEWAKIAVHLNGLGLGAQKDPEKWQQTWRDWKGNIRKKVSKIKEDINKTGGGKHDPPKLTPIEERILSIIGMDSITGMEGVPETNPPIMFEHLPTEVDSQSCLTPSVDVKIEVLDQYAEVSPSTQTEALPSVSKAATHNTVETPRKKRRRDWRKSERPQTISKKAKTALTMEERFLKMEEKKLELRELELQLEARRLDKEEKKVEMYGSLAAFLTKATEVAQRYLDHQAAEK